MADPVHLDRIRDVASWNVWRSENPDELPDLSEADLRGADLRGANLRRANLTAANLTQADLSGADLSLANLTAANLAQAHLRGADMRVANLTAANLAQADLSGANLISAKLQRAQLAGADLSGANLSGAKLQEAQLAGALGEAMPEARGAQGGVMGGAAPSVVSPSGAAPPTADLAEDLLEDPAAGLSAGGLSRSAPPAPPAPPAAAPALPSWAREPLPADDTGAPGAAPDAAPFAAPPAAGSRVDDVTLYRVEGGAGFETSDALIKDDVEFTITTPPTTQPGNSSVLDLWVHLEVGIDEVLERAAHNAGTEGFADRTFVGPSVQRGAVIVATLHMPAFTVQFPENQILWNGKLAQASFTFLVPPERLAGQYPAHLTLHVNGLCIAMLNFTLAVSDAADRALFSVKPYRKVFASYSSEDRNAVFGRVQGMQKIMPEIEVFVDVASLRAGDNWQTRIRAEIESSDAFYLFWSESASKSEWVEREWRIALQKPGLDRIDPVPLVSPEVVPPPPELAGDLHFNDWTLAFMRNQMEVGNRRSRSIL